LRGGTRFGALLVLSQAPSEDWRTNRLPCRIQVVVVAGIKLAAHDLAVDETDDGAWTIGTTSPQIEAASNDRQGDMARPLVYSYLIS